MKFRVKKVEIEDKTLFYGEFRRWFVWTTCRYYPSSGKPLVYSSELEARNDIADWRCRHDIKSGKTTYIEVNGE